MGKEDQMEEGKCLEKKMAKCKPKQIPRETWSAEESKQLRQGISQSRTGCELRTG